MRCAACRRQDAWRAKYSLQHVVRIHMGASDAAFNVIGRSGLHVWAALAVRVEW